MIYNFKGLKVTVVGMARSGLPAGLLLKQLEAYVSVVDSGDSADLSQNRERLLRQGVKAEVNADERDFIKVSDLVVVSPGVDESSEPIKFAKEKNIPVISELELAFQNCSAPIIAVTGTNGKTTVSTLIAEVLKANGKKVFLCGNIGTAFSSQVLKADKDDFVVLEVSSFQLEKIEEFRPKISLFLNFSPDHLDRYKTIDEYLEAKKRIYLNQKDTDWVVLNFADKIVGGLESSIKANVRFFNKPTNRDYPSNLDSNQQAVMAIVSILSLNRQTSLAVLSDFKGIAHRLEFVRRLSDIDFINDSKATNISSTRWALERIQQAVILIAGGRNKGADFSQLKDIVRKKIKLMFVIGESKDELFDTFANVTSVSKADSLEAALKNAFKSAESGDCILLSPMCASFDMFGDYQERGEKFKQFVRSLNEADKK
ncbi:MAG: hypothetical protein KJ593_03775 [Candidatus Omnitrophica bacterium]|nr:hypothetical protein [Candidatus Omnitrophota bacterium]